MGTQKNRPANQLRKRKFGGFEEILESDHRKAKLKMRRTLSGKRKRHVILDDSVSTPTTKRLFKSLLSDRFQRLGAQASNSLS